MRIIKKNQVIIFVIVLMLITAGYFNYNTETNSLMEASSIIDSEEMAAIGDATLVNSGELVDNAEMDENSVNNVDTDKEGDNEIIVTSSSVDNYYAESRLTRDTMYSQMLETYQKILESSNVSETQKQIASQEITNINNRKNAIMICENLIKNKGIEDVLIFINDKSISVIVKADSLTEEQIAQVQNIIARELSAEVDNIHISTRN